MTDEPEQIPDSSTVSIPASDRRAHPRQRIRALSYVQLGDGNGGIVLNISEGGIAVQAAELLDDAEGEIAMRIEIPGSRKRLEVSGEIVWVGESRKEAGFRFVNLREDALKRIRSWIEREASPGAAKEESEAEEEAPAVKPEAVSAATVAAGHAVAREEDPITEDDRSAAEDEEHGSEIEARLDGAEEPAEFDEEAVDEPLDEPAAEPVEVAEDAAVAMKASAGVAEENAAAAPALRKEEDHAEKNAPSALTFEKKPLAPVAPFTGISGTHGAPAFAMAVAPPSPARYSTGDAAASLFPKTRVSGEPAAASDDGWKSFRVQLQSGWFLAVLVLLLATISFVAGMAVRRGALNAVMGDVDDVVQPKSAPAPSAVNPASNPNGNGAAAAAASAPATPLQIEIVDLENHRWTIPATNGASRGDASATRPTQANSNPADSARAADDTVASAAAKVPNQNSAPAAPPNEAASAKSGAPLMLSLPETPISASGSIAIRATGMVPIPSGDIQSAEQARNLKIGELTNLVEPVYPPDARQARVEGTVKLHVVVAANGEIQSFRTVSGPEPLAQAAMTAVREWRYRPTYLNGKAVETQEDVTFVFRLPN